MRTTLFKAAISLIFLAKAEITDDSLPTTRSILHLSNMSVPLEVVPGVNMHQTHVLVCRSLKPFFQEPSPQSKVMQRFYRNTSCLRKKGRSKYQLLNLTDKIPPITSATENLPLPSSKSWRQEEPNGC